MSDHGFFIYLFLGGRIKLAFDRFGHVFDLSRKFNTLFNGNLLIGFSICLSVY